MLEQEEEGRNCREEKHKESTGNRSSVVETTDKPVAAKVSFYVMIIKTIKHNIT